MNGSGNWRASLSRDAPQRFPGAGRAAAQTFNFDASPGLRMLLELISAPLYEQERRSRGRRGKQGERDLRATKLPPAGRGKPTVENGTALRPRDKLLAGHAVRCGGCGDLRRWRVLWLPRNTSSIIAKDKPKHADFEAYELSSGRPIDDERGRECTLQRDCV